MYLQKVRFGEPAPRLRSGEQQALQRPLVQPLRQRPADALGFREARVLADNAFGQPQRGGDLCVAQARRVLQAQDIGELAHGDPSVRHPASLYSEQKDACMPAISKNYQR